MLDQICKGTLLASCLLTCVACKKSESFEPSSKTPSSPSTNTKTTESDQNRKSPPSFEKAEASSTDGLRLATWNIEWLDAHENQGGVKRSRADYERLRSYATQLDADIIAVQEVDGEAAVKRVFPPSEYEYFIADQPGNQDTGFVVRRELSVTRHSDLERLDVGGLRVGVDIGFEFAGAPVRLLGVHLKSRCFSGALSSSRSCKKLARQIPHLESWIDERQREGAAYAVVGDFNRRLFGGPDDPIWSELNDNEPKGLLLWSPTKDRRAKCNEGKYPDFIDHIVVNQKLRGLIHEETFAEHVYLPADARYLLSDHCALSIDIGVVNRESRQPPEVRDEVTMKAHTGAEIPGPMRPAETELIKGNISRSGKKLYHLPSCPSYAVTRITESKGEQFFETESAAIAAGFVKANNCP